MRSSPGRVLSTRMSFGARRVVGSRFDRVRQRDYINVCMLFASYSQLIDAGRYRAWSELFDPDAVLVLRGEETGGRHQIRERLQRDQREGVRREGVHLISNIVVARAADRLLVDATALYVTDVASEGATVAMAATYHSHLVLSGSGWTFRRHEIYSVKDRPNDLLVER